MSYNTKIINNDSHHCSVMLRIGERNIVTRIRDSTVTENKMKHNIYKGSNMKEIKKHHK